MEVLYFVCILIIPIAVVGLGSLLETNDKNNRKNNYD